VAAPAEHHPQPRVRVLRIISRLNVGGPALHALLLNDRLDQTRYDSRLVAGQVGEAEGDYLALHGAVPERFVPVPALGREVRLRYAYFVKCVSVVKDPSSGEVTELRCTYDPATRGGDSPDGRKVKATLHWVSAEHALGAEVRLYDHLFAKPDPEEVREGQDFFANLNPNSLERVADCRVEPSLANASAPWAIVCRTYSQKNPRPWMAETHPPDAAPVRHRETRRE